MYNGGREVGIQYGYTNPLIWIEYGCKKWRATMSWDDGCHGTYGDVKNIQIPSGIQLEYISISGGYTGE